MRLQSIAARLEHGTEQLGKGERAAALKTFTETLAASDGADSNGRFRSNALTGIALAQFASGKPREAVAAADEALRSANYRDPQKGAMQAYQARAIARAALGQVNESIADHMAALAANPAIVNEYWYWFDRCGTPVTNDMQTRIQATLQRRCPMFSLGSVPVDPALIPQWFPMFVDAPVLLSNGGITVHGRKPSAVGDWCGKVYPISVTLRVADPAFVFSAGNAEYRRVVETMALPAIRSHCGFANSIYIANEVSAPQAIGINMISVRAGATGGWQYETVGESRADSLASLRQEELGQATRQITGGDPALLRHFPYPSGITNAMRICNESGGTVKVGMVWQNTIGNTVRSALSGPFAPSGFEAAGFAEIANGSCQRVGFGLGNGPVSGYLSVFKSASGLWYASGAGPGKRDGDAELNGADRWICWPDDLASSVDPDRSCEGDRRNVKFGMWFKRSAAADQFTITVYENEYGMSAKKWVVVQ